MQFYHKNMFLEHIFCSYRQYFVLLRAFRGLPSRPVPFGYVRRLAGKPAPPPIPAGRPRLKDSYRQAAFKKNKAASKACDSEIKKKGLRTTTRPQPLRPE